MRGASIQIGAGALLAGIVGFWSDTAAFAFLIALGALLLSHGVYDDFIKPRFRVDRRLAEWLLRRGWHVRIERISQFNFVLHLTAPDSGKHIFITRQRHAINDVLAFTGKVGLHPKWEPYLLTMPERARKMLFQEMTIFLAAKNLTIALSDPRDPSGGPEWPPAVATQTALPQDHTLSEHSVDIAAKTIEGAMMGIRALIRKAIIEAFPDADITDSGL